MFGLDIQTAAEKVVHLYTSERRKIVTAESCTGGLIAGSITAIPGSSAVFERGFVSYSNDAKTELLGVMPERLVEFGAVSPEVASDMAFGALEFSMADIAISVTGIAGPDGGGILKPVGLVYFGIAARSGVLMNYRCQFSGDRNDIRIQCVEEALKLLITMAGSRNEIQQGL